MGRWLYPAGHILRILIVLTSYVLTDATAQQRDCGFQDFATAYYLFRDSGAEVVLASPAGGRPPLGPSREIDSVNVQSVARFQLDPTARDDLSDTLRLDQVHAADFDTAFYPGGLGSLWDLAQDQLSGALIAAMSAAGKPTALVAHAPAALLQVRLKNGDDFVKGRRLTATSRTEDAKLANGSPLPLQLETELRNHGALYSSDADWSCHVVCDGTLITGQNTASTADAARALLAALQA